ncbi:MAG: SH3 domain-containing protein [Roseiflexaceae bacterium]|nr:SH3 domain-containing protein [Roseiflexaceae bacterium]
MPSKLRKEDWEKLFGPHAPRRGGPLQALGTVLLALLLIGGLIAGTQFLLRYQADRQEIALARATVLAATAFPQATATALARTATVEALATARAVAAQPTTPAGLGLGTVTQGGNLRREPAIDDANVLGLIWPGDQINLLEQRDVAGQTWYRIQVTTPAADRSGEGVAAGTQGWASALLIAGSQ